jgi:hypothetical protein
VSELNGFLNALRLLNDEVGFRHGFFADLVRLGSNTPQDVVRRYFKSPALPIEEVDSRQAGAVVERFIFNNYSPDEGKEGRMPGISEQLIYYFHYYLELAALNRSIRGRWTARLGDGEAAVITQIDDYLVLVVLSIRKEMVP